MAGNPEKNRLERPAGLSYKEEAQWWDDHPEYWDQFDESDLEVIEPGLTGRTVRLPYMKLPVRLVDGIHSLAVKAEMRVPQLIQTWLEERLEAERKSPAKKRAKPQH